MHEANGCKFIPENDMIVRWVRKERRDFEPETTAFLMSAPDGPFVDVGASTGWFSVPMAKGRKVYAFEPLPTSRERLIANAALNEVEIDVFAGAASNKTGEAVLHFNAGLPLTSGASLQKAFCLVPSGNVKVPTWRLDDALEDVDPAIIKIDVEGHEIAVLEGAEQIISRARPLLVLEANTQEHEAALAVWLDDHDYEYVNADERNLLCTPAS